MTKKNVQTTIPTVVAAADAISRRLGYLPSLSAALMAELIVSWADVAAPTRLVTVASLVTESADGGNHFRLVVYFRKL